MKPEEIVNLMYEKDSFSQWLGIQIEKISAGTCQLRMKVREEMVNGFGIAHGGISYALADSALAFASNSIGFKSVSIETSISHHRPIHLNDILVAEAKLDFQTSKIAWFTVTIKVLNRQKVATFRGTVYRKEEW